MDTVSQPLDMDKPIESFVSEEIISPLIQMTHAGHRLNCYQDFLPSSASLLNHFSTFTCTHQGTSVQSATPDICQDQECGGAESPEISVHPGTSSYTTESNAMGLYHVYLWNSLCHSLENEWISLKWLKHCPSFWVSEVMGSIPGLSKLLQPFGYVMAVVAENDQFRKLDLVNFFRSVPQCTIEKSVPAFPAWFPPTSMSVSRQPDAPWPPKLKLRLEVRMRQSCQYIPSCLPNEPKNPSPRQQSMKVSYFFLVLLVLTIHNYCSTRNILLHRHRISHRDEKTGHQTWIQDIHLQSQFRWLLGHPESSITL